MQSLQQELAALKQQNLTLQDELKVSQQHSRAQDSETKRLAENARKLKDKISALDAQREEAAGVPMIRADGEGANLGFKKVIVKAAGTAAKKANIKRIAEVRSLEKASGNVDDISDADVTLVTEIYDLAIRQTDTEVCSDCGLPGHAQRHCPTKAQARNLRQQLSSAHAQAWDKVACHEKIMLRYASDLVKAKETLTEKMQHSRSVCSQSLVFTSKKLKKQDAASRHVGLIEEATGLFLRSGLFHSGSPDSSDREGEGEGEI